MSTVVHAVIAYFFLLLTVRVLSRRPGAQITLFEFVIVFLIGGITILSTVGPDKSETNSVCAVLTVGLLHRVVSGLKQHSKTLSALVDGQPLVLLDNGEWRKDIMRKMRLQDTDVMAAARSKGHRSLSDIKYAVLERNGGISVFEKKD